MIIHDLKLKFKSGAVFGVNNPKHIIVHHALKKFCTVQDVHKWHLDNGWTGIGYHYFINKSGLIFRGRQDNENGAHCAEENMNYKSIGICLEGCFEDAGLPFDVTVPDVQLSALILLTRSLMKQYTIQVTNVKKHADYAKYKLCPGNFFPWKEYIAEISEMTLEQALTFISHKTGIDYDTWLAAAVTNKLPFLDIFIVKIAKTWKGENK